MLIARRVGGRGFTLVELMTVVSIVGILSALAAALVSKHVNASRTGEALAIVQSIRAAQESYRAENRRYLSVSNAITDYYPAQKPDGRKRAFYRGGGDALDARWNILRPVIAGPVRFVYATVAGDSGSAVPALSIANAPTFPTPSAPFYVIQAAGDMDADGDQCMVAATSFTSETYVENEGE